MDFDKKGILIFQNQPLSQKICEIIKLNSLPKIEYEFKDLEFSQIFEKNNEIFKKAMYCLQKKIRFKNLKEFLVSKIGHFGSPLFKEAPLTDKLSQKVKVIARAKSKNFKGFYILVQLQDKNAEEDEEEEDFERFLF